MNKITHHYFLIALITAGLSCDAFAADTIPVPAGSRIFEMMPVIYPWMGTSNPAALSVSDIGKMSFAQAGVMHKDDDIKLTQQPGITTSYHAATEGFMKLGRLSLFGSFRYANNRYDDLIYNGTLMFNTLNPYLLGDSVSARQFIEGFNMKGGLSYQVNNRITIAANGEYTSDVGAKQKDPRNENTISLLKVSPGIIYDLGKTKIGLSGSVYTTSNEISYSVEGNWNQNLFVFLGLGYFRPELNISSYSQWYTGKGYAGALQASYTSGNIFAVAELSYDHFNEEARSGSSFRLIDGIAEINHISFTGLLRITKGKALHLVSLDGSLKAMNGDEILQRSYTVNKGTYSYDSLATVSWIKNKHMISDINADAQYSFIVFDRQGNIDIETGGGVLFEYFSTEHFPVQSYGFYNTTNLRGSLYAKKLFKFDNLMITPGIDACYRMNLGSDISYIVQPLSIPEMIYHDFNVTRADMIRGEISLRLELPVNSKFINSLYMVSEASYGTTMGSEAGDLSGYWYSAAAGITF